MAAHYGWLPTLDACGQSLRGFDSFSPRGRIDLRTEQAFFDFPYRYVSHTHHVEPHGEVGGLKIEFVFRQVLPDLNAPGTHGHSLFALQPAELPTIIKGEKNIFLRNHVNQVFELVGNPVIPHG